MFESCFEVFEVFSIREFKIQVMVFSLVLQV